MPCPILPFPRPIRTFLSFQINSGIKSGPRYNFKTEKSTETKWTQIMKNKERRTDRILCVLDTGKAGVLGRGPTGHQGTWGTGRDLRFEWEKLQLSCGKCTEIALMLLER